MAPKKTKLLYKDNIVKSLKGFVKDEDGFVSKETILKVGLATVAGLAAFGTAGTAAAANHSNHTNSITTANAVPSLDPNPYGCFQHTNVISHSSY